MIKIYCDKEDCRLKGTINIKVSEDHVVTITCNTCKEGVIKMGFA